MIKSFAAVFVASAGLAIAQTGLGEIPDCAVRYSPPVTEAVDRTGPRLAPPSMPCPSLPCRRAD